MPLYHLSNAQRKALLVNGQPIILALPIPASSDPEERGDLLAWARAQLPQDVRMLARQAHCDLVTVAPKLSGGRANLTEVLGDILTGYVPADVYTIAIDACLVTLRPQSERRGTSPRPQWPLNVIHGGKPLIDRDA
ncbi:MAG: hypothetical protein EBR82_29930 [Caulobacteraceae bacterium]|nr:hypothetical protein [Caulobacteraceae bacterium]